MAKGSVDVKVEFLVDDNTHKYRVYINNKHVPEIEPSETLMEAADKLLAYLNEPAGL